MNFIKNFFLLFLSAYFIVIGTKFVFLFYLIDTFENYNILKPIYAIFWGYKFDFAISSIVALITTFFDFHKKSFVIVGSFLISLLFLVQISDIMYFFESSRHIGYEISDVMTDALSLFLTALSQHSLLSTIGFFVSLILFIFLYKMYSIKLHTVKIDKFYIVKKISIVIIAVFFIRGMFQHIPLNPWQSNQIGDVKLATLSLNGSYNSLYAIANKKKQLKPLRLPFIDTNTTKESFKSLYANSYIPYTSKLNKPNIVLFFLESWSGVNMKSYGYNKTTTPFFDDILAKSIHTKGMIAGGHRTTEGLFSVLCSFQNPLGKTIAKTQLQNFTYNSIVNILAKHGYKSMFFQGSSKETSGTGSLAQKLGFQESYGKRDIKTRKYAENYWGVQDPDLYDFVFTKIDSKPFIVGINGATTHDDQIPKDIKPIKFTDNKAKNRQLNALHFSDFALGKFVNKVKQKYPNTIFVFFADHCGGVTSSAFENYLIPFAIYHKDIKPKYYDFYISQRDIAPSILDMVFGKYKDIKNNFQGKSLFSDQDFFADYYHNGILGWIENNHLLELNLATDKYNCYDVSTYKPKNIMCNHKLKKYKNRLLSFTKISQNMLFDGNTTSFDKKLLLPNH